MAGHTILISTVVGLGNLDENLTGGNVAMFLVVPLLGTITATKTFNCPLAEWVKMFIT